MEYSLKITEQNVCLQCFVREEREFVEGKMSAVDERVVSGRQRTLAQL